MSVRLDGGWAYVNPSYGKPKPICICWGHQFGTPHAKDCPRYRAPSDDRVKYSDLSRPKH